MKEKQSAIRKKIARIIKYRQRFKAISSHDQITARKVKLSIILLLFYQLVNEEEDTESDMVIDILLQEYLTTVFRSSYSASPMPENNRNLIMDYPYHEYKF